MYKNCFLLFVTHLLAFNKYLLYVKYCMRRWEINGSDFGFFFLFLFSFVSSLSLVIQAYMEEKNAKCITVIPSSLLSSLPSSLPPSLPPFLPFFLDNLYKLVPFGTYCKKLKAIYFNNPFTERSFTNACNSYPAFHLSPCLAKIPAFCDVCLLWLQRMLTF